MRKLITGLFTCFYFLALSQCCCPEVTEVKNVWIFGQSNALRFNASNEFAQFEADLSAHYGMSVMLNGLAAGGAYIGDLNVNRPSWRKEDNDLYPQLVQQYKDKQATLGTCEIMDVPVIIWIQGETESLECNPEYTQYETDLLRFFSNIRHDVFIGQDPDILIVQVSDNFCQNLCSLDEVRADQNQVADLDSKVHLINFDGAQFTIEDDCIHFDANGFIEMRQAFINYITGNGL